ncbi:Hachiman antiphage defense system protein HamA, partial [Allofournierella sp.]|uniref:Hachiman antiphage defense system protein HamA n=1 Tax=Allofournierella sp. TaxID=1940256 RepID=UPI003AB1BA9D
VQKDKIGKIGEYTFHVLLSNYYKVHCIIPKFKCTTDRNMSVFGIDALFYDPVNCTILFGESKVCKNIDNAIVLINRSLSDYESQISEEYKLVLSNNESFNLSAEFLDVFKAHTDICITFEDFIKAAHINKICVPTFIAHGNSGRNDTVDNYLARMKLGIAKKNYFGLNTEYLFISLPIIDKAKMMDVIMRKVVKKCDAYRAKHSAL